MNMSGTYLQRETAPFGNEVWEQIDAAVVETARNCLYGRRLLSVEGPFGLGLKSLDCSDRQSKEKSSDDTGNVMFSSSLPLAMVQKNFVLGSRDIAAFEREKLPMDLDEAAKAAIACAEQENELIFSGSKGHFFGLLNTQGIHNCRLKKWDEAGRAVEDLIHAVNMLDGSGFHGPYALALAPELYNNLFHLYPQSNTTEIQQISDLITKGVFKAGGISGGILIAHGKQFASILLGQDMMTGFVGPVNGAYEFSLTESFALRLLVPEAICALKMK